MRTWALGLVMALAASGSACDREPARTADRTGTGREVRAAPRTATGGPLVVFGIDPPGRPEFDTCPEDDPHEVAIEIGRTFRGHDEVLVDVGRDGDAVVLTSGAPELEVRWRLRTQLRLSEGTVSRLWCALERSAFWTVQASTEECPMPGERAGMEYIEVHTATATRRIEFREVACAYGDDDALHELFAQIRVLTGTRVLQGADHATGAAGDAAATWTDSPSCLSEPGPGGAMMVNLDIVGEELAVENVDVGGDAVGTPIADCVASRLREREWLTGWAALRAQGLFLVRAHLEISANLPRGHRIRGREP